MSDGQTEHCEFNGPYDREARERDEKAKEAAVREEAETGAEGPSGAPE